MKKSHLIRLLAFGMSLALGILIAGVTGAVGGSQLPAGTCRDLVKSIHDNVEYNTVYDPEHNLITVEGGGRTFTFDPRDKACRHASRLVNGIVTGALDLWSSTLDGDCPQVRHLVATHATNAMGRHVNQNGARKFISKWCGNH